MTQEKPEYTPNPLRQGDHQVTSEEEQWVIVGVQEIDLSITDQAQHYLRLLQDEANRAHFTGIPERVKDLIEKLKQPGIHGLVGINSIGEVLGFAVVSDAERDQHDNWVEKIVIENDLQNQGSSDTRHVGTQFLHRIVEWAFTTKTYDGRERTKLDAAVIMGVPNWERPYHLFTNNGFVVRMINPKQADIVVGNLQMTKDVVRVELMRADWEVRKFYLEHHRTR